MTAQKAAVTGTVKDASGETLIGASIRVVGTTQGTITGTDGTYNINVPDAKSVLEFSYLGYVTQAVTVGDRKTVYVIMLEDTKTLDEVVVIFPSIALGWTFTNEEFFKWEPMDFGKLRLSWGENGNRSLNDPYVSPANLGSGMGTMQGYVSGS